MSISINIKDILVFALLALNIYTCININSIIKDIKYIDIEYKYEDDDK